MPAVSPNIIVNQIINAIQQSGGVAAYVSESVRTHPRKFVVSYLGNSYSLWVYIWTLTHGGRVSLPDEFRIQMTSVSSPLPLNPSGLTVLMGYHPDLGVFAGFDLRKHRTFTTGSPSVQINIAALHDALQNGLSFANKDTYEKIKITIKEGVEAIPDVEFTETRELGHVNRVDPLGITYLRVRGMWGIENPFNVFSYVYKRNENNIFSFMCLINQDKFDTFENTRELYNLAQNNKYLEILDVKIKNPNNPAQLRYAKLITFHLEALK